MITGPTNHMIWYVTNKHYPDLSSHQYRHSHYCYFHIMFTSWTSISQFSIRLYHHIAIYGLIIMHLQEVYKSYAGFQILKVYKERLLPDQRLSQIQWWWHERNVLERYKKKLLVRATVCGEQNNQLDAARLNF